MVRVSFGLYNTTEEIDILIEMLQRIAEGNYFGMYSADGGDYAPAGTRSPIDDYVGLMLQPAVCPV
jgi:hypothetical protein